MSFTALLEDLEALQKAKAPVDEGDEKIKAAADEDVVDREEADVEEGEAADKKKEKKADHKEPDGDEGKEPEMASDDDGDEDDSKEKPFGKSFSVTLEDGAEVEAYDGTELLKSFDERLSSFGTQLSEIELLKSQLVEFKEKQLGEIERVMEEQNKLLKSLTQQVTALQSEGKGRKTVLTVHEKPSIAGTEAPPATPNNETLLTKALALQKQGKLSGFDVSRIDAHLGRGLPPPAELLRQLI